MRQQRRNGPDLVGLTPGFDVDPQLGSVTFTAAFLFLKIVAAIHRSGTDGRASLSLVAGCATGLRNLKRYLEELCESELLRWDKVGCNYVVTHPLKWLTPTPPSCTDLAPNLHRSRPDLAPNLHRTSPEAKSVSPAQTYDDRGPRARSPAQPYARAFEVPSTKWTDGTPKVVRNPQPRSGGRAREIAEIRAPWDPPDGDTIPGAAGADACRQAIAKTQANSPHSRGKASSFSKYDPNRPIEPITSAMVWKADSK